MKTVGDFWFRIGFSAVLVIAGFIAAAAENSGLAVFLIVIGAINGAWTVIQAKRIIRKADRIQSER